MRGFRVYDKQEKRMIDNPCTEGMYLSGNGNLVKPASLALYLMDRYVRMDSTGIMDKNGKEIYEGDIVKDTRGWVSEVRWDNLRGCFLGYHSKPRGDVYIEYVSREPKSTIIGNIYDNPELLKESNK